MLSQPMAGKADEELVKTRGCRIEHDAAVVYGLTVLYEEQEDLAE